MFQGVLGQLSFVLLLTSVPLFSSYAETACSDNRRIVGGVDTKIEEHPWHVALQVAWQDGKSRECGGALIQDGWVVTAAHCFDTKLPADVRLKAGITDYETGTWVSTGKVFVHEDYNDKTHENDIALVQLSGNVAGDIIPLAQGGEGLKECRVLEVTGWGHLKEDGPTAPVLQKAEVPLVDNSTCNAKNAYDGAIKSGMMCAGYRDGGVDSCQGDSGGPLVLRDKDGPVLVGIVSWGEGCARKLKYGVYTRVDAYSQWIASTILANQP